MEFTQEQIKEMSLQEALLNIQKELPMFKKNANGYGYKYATLEELLDVILPLCNKYDVFMTNENNLKNIDDLIAVNTIFRKDDEEIKGYEVFMPIDKNAKNKAQHIGSLITYGRRYSLCATLSIAVSDDDGILSGSNLNAISKNQEKELLELLNKYAEKKERPVEEIINWAKNKVGKSSLNQLNQEQFFNLKEVIERGLAHD